MGHQRSGKTYRSGGGDNPRRYKFFKKTKQEKAFMAEVKTKRLSQVLREFNISLDRAVEFLGSKGFDVDASPNTKITGEEYEVLFEEFETDKSKKVASKEVGEEKRKEKEELRLERERELEEKQ